MNEMAIGVDLGGTQVRGALVARDGTVLSRASQLTSQDGPRAVIEQIASLVSHVASDTQIAGVGVCSPGPLDSDEGFIFDIATLKGWQNVPLKALLAERLGKKVLLENDGIAAALGEWKFGAGKGLSNFVYVTVSTGLGGGVVVDNHLLRGRRGLAGHIGHMKIMLNGPPCVCGGHGCWEALAGGTQFARAARKEALLLPSSELNLRANEGDITTEHISAAAKKGDQLAISLIDRLADYLGYGMSNLLHLYSPERIVIGGGVANSLDLFHAKMATAMRKHAMSSFRDVEIVRAALPGNSGLVGAAALVLDSDRGG